MFESAPMSILHFSKELPPVIPSYELPSGARKSPMKKAALFIANYTIDNSPSILNLIELLADRYHVYLFLHNVSFMKSPLLQNRNVVVINLNTSRTNINALQSENIPVHIAFDPHGFILCRTIFPECRPFYYSLELYLKNDHFGLDYPDNVCDAERDSINSIRGLIIQSREKELLFREDYGLDPSISTFLLPVTCRKNHSAKKTNFLHQKYRIPEHCRIALHLGGIAAWFSCIELAAAFAAVDGWYLLFQGYADDTYKNELLTMLYTKGITNVIISDEFFDDILDVDKVVACCDLGIAWYNNISEGFRTAGFSSGKIASYMHFGLPVIAKRYASTALSIESPGAGICIDDTREIPAALKKISENFAQYSAKAKDTFEHFFNFEKYALSFLEFLQQEPPHLASSNTLASQDYWDSGYRDMKLALAAHDDPVRRWIERFVPRGHGSCIEIGAFPGRYLAIFGELGYELHGIDLTPRVVLDLPLWLKDCGFKTGSFHQADFISFVPDQQYEIVSSFGFIEHFTNWGDVVTKHADLVADGGLLIIETPNFSGKLQKHLHTLFDSENMERHCLDAMLPEKWESVIQQLGFEIIFSGWFGGFDFWSEPANLTMQQADALENIRRIIPILKTIQEDDPSYSPYCGLIARKLPPPLPIAKTFGNILIACTHFWPSIGGVETIAENLGSQLEQLGFCVDVATLADLRRTAKHHRGIRIISLDIHNSTNGLPMWVGQLRNLVTSGNYTACILLADPRNLVIWSVEGAHVPADTRVIIQPIINDEGYREWNKDSEFRQRLALILKGAAAAVSLTRNGLEVSYMREEGVTPVYLPNAVNLVFPEHDFRRRYGIDDNEFLILHVANLWPVKNQPSLIRTVMNLSGDIRLVVIGHPSPDVDYVAQVREAAAEDPRVMLIPGLAPAHVAAAMAAADVFVLASHGEVSPVTILEAMSHRLPWLATPECGSVHDLAGGIVAPLESFPNIIENLRAGKDLRRNLGALGYHHWSACYRWEYVAQQWAHLIQQGSVSSSFEEPNDIAIRMKQLKEELNEGLFTSAEPLVSVIVPTYNRSGMLREAIQSILNQTFQHFEIIIINDAGEDISPVVRAFNSPKIVYISHETNKGLAASRNTGIRAARGKYVAYLDDDDLFYPDHLETLVTFLEKNNKFKVAYSDANEALQKKIDGEWVVVERSCTYSLEFDAEALLVNNFTPVLCVIHRRDCLDTTGVFDESLRRHEDWEMWLRMSRHFPFAHIKKITCEFTTRDDGLGMREGALPSFLVTYRSVCAKHRGLAEGNQRVQDAQQREVYSLLYRTYQFLLRKLMAGEEASSLTPTGATAVQIQSATFLYDAYNADNSEKRKRLLEQALEADPENVVAREALSSGMPVAGNTCQACEPDAQRPAASIVIVTYNSVATLSACIESVARSLLPCDEVVLVDNASRDETMAQIEQLIHGFSAFQVIRNETNAGFSAATNQGILATRNPLVVLLNPDTVVPKFWLNGLSRHLGNNVVAVGPVSNYVAGLQKMELYQKEPLPSQITIDDAAGLFLKWNDGKGVETRLLIGFCMMIRRDALEKIGYLDNELFLGNDDLDVSWRLRLQGYQLMVATDVFVFHAGQVSFSSEPSETTKRLVQQSTDHLYRKLAAHYAPAPVPPPFELWAMDWFNPSAEALEGSRSVSKTKTAVNKQLVSIIILTWNQLQFTQACLESINRNTSEPYQLIMVDNSSTDGTVQWLRDQAQADSRITVIENAENLGFAAGCNQGIREAQGEFILLLNNDTVVTPGWLAGMNELLDRYPDAGIIGPMTNSASGVQVIKAPDYIDLEELPAWAATFRENNRYRVIRQRRIVGFCMLFRKKLVEKIGLLDESFGSGNFEDDDYCLRAELAGYHNMIAGDVFVHHVGGATFNGNRINFAEAMKQNMILYRNKWNYNRLDELTLRQLILLNAIQEARRLAMRDEIDKSIELLMQNGIRVAPDNPAPYLELVEILIAAGRHNDALQVVPEMPTTTDQAAINEIESICHAAMGDDEAALQTANQVQKRSRSLVVLGTLSARREDLAGAEVLFRRAIELDPSCGSAWLSLGMLMWSQGMQEAAWQAVKRSVLVDPINDGAIKILRNMAERVERISEAAKVIGEVTQTYSDSITLLRHHAEILAQCGRTIEALDACELFLVNFGVDDSLLSLAIDLRKCIGVYDRLAEGGTQSITLCMIVKDEAEKLAACLGSVKPVVHEMIVVDTGSSDRTDDIATAFGARVYKSDWNGNFSDARNYAINKAGGKWILVVDADEVLAVQDYKTVLGAVSEASGKKQAWSVLTRNYTNKVNAQGWTANDGVYPAEERADGWHPSWKVRLFPNQPDIRFTGEVHEMVENALSIAGYTINKASFVVHHYGGLEERSVVITEKQRRYFEFGMKKLENNPNDVGAIAELAVQASEMDCFEEAVRLWDRLLENDPHNVEALFNKGYALIKLQRYQDALSISEKVLELAPDHREAAFNYGTSTLYVGKPSKALHKLEPLLKKHPDYPPLLAVMLLLYILSGRCAKAVSTYSTLKALNYAISDYVRARAEVLIQLGKEDLARRLLKECEVIGIM